MPKKFYPSRRVDTDYHSTQTELNDSAQEIKGMREDGFDLWGVKVLGNKRVLVYS